MKYIVVGNSAAGLFAVESIREQDPGADLTVLTADAYPSYSRCLTTYYLAGDIPEYRLFLRTPEALDALHLTVRYGCTVTGLDPIQHVVFTAAGERYSYDKCLLATGASAVPLEVPGFTLPQVFTLRHLDDAKRIKAELAPGRRVVIIGGGLVSLKSAYALLKQGMKVSVIISSGQILSQMLHEEAAKLLQEHLEKHGLHVILNQDVTRIEGNGHVEAIRLQNGETLPADLVIVGKGVRPNIQPFLASGLAVGQGILVNERLETNLPDVYAAGDVAESWDRVHQTRRLNAIWPNATMQGRIAGANMAGLNLTYPGAMGMNSVDFFGLRVISAGVIRPSKVTEGAVDLEKQSWRVEDARLRNVKGRPNYQRLVWEGETLKGFVLLGQTERAGLLTALIQNGQPLSDQVRRTLESGKRSRILPLRKEG